MRLRVNYFIAGLLGASLVSAITVPFLAWFYSPDALGRFSFFLLTASFAVQIGALGLDQGYVREYHTSNNKAQLLLQVLFPVAAIFVFLLLILAGFNLFAEFSTLIVSERAGLIGFFIFFAYVFSVAHRFAIVSYRVRALGWLFFLTLVSVKIVFLVCAYLAYLFSLNESFSLYGSYLISLFLPMAGLLVLRAHKLLKERSAIDVRVNWKQPLSWALLKYSVPLLFGALAFWGVKFAGHIGLRYFESYEELAFYSVGVSIAAGLGLFSSVFNTMWFPFLFKANAAGECKAALGVGINLTTAFLLFGVGVSGVVAPFVVKLLPERFAEVQLFLPILVLSSLLYTVSEVSGSGIALSKKTQYGFYSGVCASLVAISAALVLCGRFGAFGAAVSYGTGYVIFFICRTEFGRRLWPGQGVFRTYFAVFFCGVYVALCASPSLSKGDSLIYMGLCLVIFSLPLLFKSSVSLTYLRKLVR